MYSRPKKLIVDAPKAIKLLSNTKAILILQTFSSEPKSIKEAAQILKLSISNCHYWVKRFYKLGLLSIAHSKKRSGSPINYYWMAADELIIDLQQGSLKNYYQTLIDIYGELALKGLLTSNAEIDLEYSVKITANKQGYLYYLLMQNENETRTPLLENSLKPGMPASIAQWTSLELAYKDAKDLQNELYDIFQKYKYKTTRGQKGYFLQAILVAEVE